MFSFRKRKKLEEIPQINTVKTQLAKSLWRNNMWVMTPQGIGVLFKCDEPSLVHLVNDNGTTKESLAVHLNQLRQAKWLEIPECRRLVSEERAYSLGYF